MYGGNSGGYGGGYGAGYGGGGYGGYGGWGSPYGGGMQMQPYTTGYESGRMSSPGWLESPPSQPGTQAGAGAQPGAQPPSYQSYQAPDFFNWLSTSYQPGMTADAMRTGWGDYSRNSYKTYLQGLIDQMFNPTAGATGYRPAPGGTTGLSPI